MTELERQHLDELGYVVLPDFMEPDLLAAVLDRVEALFEEEGDQAGSEFKPEPHTRRLANLVNKGEIFERIIEEPRILEYMAWVLGPDFKLSSLNVRSTNPYGNCRQPLHADSGALRDVRGYWVCNSIWMLDDFTLENGAIRVVPGSHRWGRLPQDVLADPYASHPQERLITGRARTVVILNAHLWHGGTANHTAAPRRAMHVYYTRWDKPQQQYQKRLVRAEVQARLSPRARGLLALDDPLNDQLSSQIGNMSGFLK